MGTRVDDPETRLIAIEDLEEVWEEALTRTTNIQAKRKAEFDGKLPKSHGIQVGGMVLLYDMMSLSSDDSSSTLAFLSSSCTSDPAGVA